MRAYMGYSRAAGYWEGSALIFANTAKEARRLAYRSVIGTDLCDGDFLDVAVKWIKDQPWLFKLKKKDEPHFIDNPPCCKTCETWGSEVGDDGLCDACREEAQP